MQTIFCGNVVLPDRVLPGGAVLVREGRIIAVDEVTRMLAGLTEDFVRVDVGDGYLAPGFVDLHVHGGAGADFMDGTPEAFQTVLAAHLRHGTTSLLPTTTVARHERLFTVLELCRQYQGRVASLGPRVLGAHFYGPYFNAAAVGCHPGEHLSAPDPSQIARYMDYADVMLLATIAPELPGTQVFCHLCRERGIGVNIGHSHATFAQVAQAVQWGARHVDHLYCAMSDKTKLRQTNPFPMQGGVLEATLWFDELTTEVIADGRHLSADLLLLAWKIKGVDRLALVTDCSRALDMPDGEYVFGPLTEGERFLRRDEVGIMPDGEALASSVQGMDHMVRTFQRLTGRPLDEVIRMASLTPARIIGRDREIGSIEPGKCADLLILSPDLHVKRIFVDGVEQVLPAMQWSPVCRQP